MIEQVAGDDFRVAGKDGFGQGVVNEDVLILGLYDVIPLRAQTRHVTVNVDGFVVFEALQHGIDDNVAAGPSHALRTVGQHRAGV